MKDIIADAVREIKDTHKELCKAIDPFMDLDPLSNSPTTERIEREDNEDDILEAIANAANLPKEIIKNR